MWKPLHHNSIACCFSMACWFTYIPSKKHATRRQSILLYSLWTNNIFLMRSLERLCQSDFLQHYRVIVWEDIVLCPLDIWKWMRTVWKYARLHRMFWQSGDNLVIQDCDHYMASCTIGNDYRVTGIHMHCSLDKRSYGKLLQVLHWQGIVNYQTLAEWETEMLKMSTLADSLLQWQWVMDYLVQYQISHNIEAMASQIFLVHTCLCNPLAIIQKPLNICTEMSRVRWKLRNQPKQLI